MIFISVVFYYLYHLNNKLTRELEGADRACQQELNTIAYKYQKQKSRISAQIPYPPNMDELSRVKVKSKIDNLASHGHLIRAVNHKYEFLLRSAQLKEQEKKRLLHLLVKREKLSSVTFQSFVEAGDAAREEIVTKLAVAESNIKDLLVDPIDYDRYEYLKNRTVK
jgi:hypothetical protein